MKATLNHQVQWWVWWSNPETGIHPDWKDELQNDPYLDQSDNILALIQKRSMLGLSDVPDEQFANHPWAMALVLAPEELRLSCTVKFGVLTLDNSVLHARPHDWKSQFNVDTAENIRTLIQLKNDIPHPVSRWQDQVANLIANNTSDSLWITERQKIGLGVYLRSRLPQLWKRWTLTESRMIKQWVERLPLLDEHQLEALETWIADDITPLTETVLAEDQQTMMNSELELDELFDELDMFDLEQEATERHA